MTVTREQAQMLTTLAIACRPYGAPTWDAAGVMASIAHIKDWSLSEVALRVIVAAADREAKTPGVIATQQVPELKPALFKPNAGELRDFCGVCGKKQPDCGRARFADDDHVFTPDTRVRADIDTERAAQALKELVATAEPPAPVERPTPEPNPHATAARTLLAVSQAGVCGAEEGES
jgi:hypothetical protein